MSKFSLRDAARHLVYPSNIKATAWPRIEAKARTLGVSLDPWQQSAAKILLGKGADGRFACSVGGFSLSIPRQVGKTYLMMVIAFCLALLYPDALIIWTAHHTRTANESFESMRGFARRKKVAPFIRRVTSGAGQQGVHFVNGSRILFGARDSGFGRGFTKVSMLVFDEAQILNESALSDMIPATNQAPAPFPLVLFVGTPPRPKDPGEVFTNRRNAALSGRLEHGAFIEFSGDPDASSDDRQQVLRANPSVPERTPWASIQRMKANMTDEEWRREGLGIWDSDGSRAVIPAEVLGRQVDEASSAVRDIAVGFEVGQGGGIASVSMVGIREDGDLHFELLERRSGSAWVGAYLSDLIDANPEIRCVVTDPYGPSGLILEQRPSGFIVRGTSVLVTEMKVFDIGLACGHTVSALEEGRAWHIGQAQFLAAAEAATVRRLGDTGKWTWKRGDGSVDITPVQSVSWALHGCMAPASKVISPKIKFRSSR